MAIEFSERTKTFLRLGLFLGATLFIGLMIFWFFFASPPSVVVQEDAEETVAGGNLPGAGTGSPQTGTGQQPAQSGTGALPGSSIAQGGKTITTQLTKSAITSPRITETGAIAYYDAADGRFYTMDSKGNAEPLSLEQFPSAETVVFNNTADAAVIEFPDGSNIVYNFTTAKQTTLPEHWEDFSFSQDGEEIVAKSVGSDPANRALVVTSADGSTTSVLAPLGDNDDKVTVSWSPQRDIVGFSATGEGGTSAFGQRKIYTIGENGEAAGIITVNGTNYEHTWSPSGKYLLYSIADSGDDYRPSLWYVDAKGDRNGDTRIRLGIKTTVDRCTFFDEQTLYCGIPETTPPGSGGNPEILEGPDYLYKISLPSGERELLALPTIPTVIKNISLNETGSILYYTDGFDQLNMIRLK